MHLKILFSFILFIVIEHGVYAQNDIYKFSHLDIANGLSDNQVDCIFKDKQGFMWFGTISGLNRYDGHKFKVFKHDNTPNSLGENNVITIDQGPEDKMWVFTHSGVSVYDPLTEKFSPNPAQQLALYNIHNAEIKSIRGDNKGNFWFITQNSGVYRYNEKNHTTSYYGSSPNAKVALHSNVVMDIAKGEKNDIWLIYNDGVIDQIDFRENKVISRYDDLKKIITTGPQVYSLNADSRSNLWIYSGQAPIGVYCVDTKTKSFTHFGKDEPVNKLKSNVINTVIEADDNKIWIGTDHGGISVIDPLTHKIIYLVNKEDDPKSLSGNSIRLFKDNTGIIWAGTFKQGINYYHGGIMQFPLYKHFATDKNSLPYDDVNCFVENKAGDLWIGTNGGGLIYFNRHNNTFTQYKHDAANPNSLASDVIVRLFIDEADKLWVGMYFGGMDYYDGNKFTHHRHDDKDPASISDDRVYSIMQDSKKDIWVGTFAGGLNVYDRKNNKFKHPKYYPGPYYTAVVYEDRSHNIWVGRDSGLNVINTLTNTTRHYAYDPKNPNSLAGNDVNTVLQDSKGLMWIGTKDGLSILNTQTNKFLTAADGFSFPTNNVSNIIEDKQGRVWVSTNNGVASVMLTEKDGKYNFQLQNFNESDGFQARGFNLNAAALLKSGEIIFGGAHGFNLFDPKFINTVKPEEKLVFTDFQLFNKSVSAGEAVKGRIILSRSIAETQSITLNHNENVFSIEFASCDYFNPDKISYQYMLEGFDKGWVSSPENDRKATYTNLDARDFVFNVRALNTNNPAQSSLITLNIKILPPFWETPFAYLLYFLAVMGILFYIRSRGIIKLKREFELKQGEIETERKIANEREEARRMHQLDLMKIKFFTNVSHEFRTPLSLILSPIDELINNADKPEQQHHLVMIKRNGKRLLNLVNQLLDFRKMEYNELKLCLKKGDIVKFIKEVSSSFTDVAHQKEIQYVFESELCSFTTNFDHDKIERVLFNLLSNAFKFTPSGGHISVIVSLLDSELVAEGQKMLEIKVIDTGIGIPVENQEKIFERFFQDNIPESLLNQGSGIGLSITKEFVKMHGGNIKIESEPDYGTCFIMNIPVGELEDELLVDVAPQEEFPYRALKHTEETNGSAKKPTILIVEDNDDLRFYLKDNLKNSFHIIEAGNGKDGWQKALALHPKLIVSDISMPEMNGLELCKKIKADNRTAQIPVILLTALMEERDQLKGLESGANDYIVKPFNFEILLSKIHNLLRMQQTMKETYQKQVEIQAKEIAVVSEDEKFMKNALEYIEKNITNPNFSVEELSKHLNLSRVSLYKKLLTLTGKTPVDCIRTIRLKRAVQLLEKSKLSIANVAYEVGFNNAAYFAKVFREEFGILPSEYLNKMQNKVAEEVLD